MSAKISTKTKRKRTKKNAGAQNSSCNSRGGESRSNKIFNLKNGMSDRTGKFRLSRARILCD